MRVKTDSLPIEELRFRLRSELYEPGAAEYEDTCTLFDAMVQRRPRLVARCTAATWADVHRAAQEHGLATTGGRVSTTGVAGLTMGGGSGWLERKHGLACDNLLSASREPERDAGRRATWEMNYSRSSSASVASFPTVVSSAAASRTSVV